MNPKMKLPQRMRFKIFLLCLSCTLTALLLQTWLFNTKSSALIYNQAKKESLSLLQNMQDDLFSMLKSMENNIIEVYNRRQLIRDLTDRTFITDLRDRYYREAYNIAMECFDTSDGVVALYLYDADDAIVSTYRRAVTPRHNYPMDIYDGPEAYNSDIVRSYAHSDDTAMLVSSYYNPDRQTDLVRLVMKLYHNSNTSQVIGYVVCDIDSKVFRYRMEKFITDDDMFVWLQPLRDRAAVNIGRLEGRDRETFRRISDTLNRGDRKFLLPSGGQDRVLFQVEQNKYNFHLYALMPQTLLVANQRTLASSLMIIAALMLVITPATSYICSKNLTRPLEALTDATKRIKEGETALRVNVDKQDELGELGQSFNEMLDQIQALLTREYETKLLLNQAEYHALQAQINPHFLYNTLDTMSSIAQIRHCDEVSRLCQSLSNIFRYSLDMKNPFSTVAKEIVHLKNYLYVMNVRMQDHVIYDFQIEDEVLKDTVPRICIQPIVENALTHGLRNAGGEKRIAVRARAEGGNLVICVTDNGVGLDHAEILNRKLEENDLAQVEQGSSIGLANINARVKMLYGNDYGIRIESSPGAGTNVTLTVSR